MSQLFPKSSNALAKSSIAALAFLVLTGGLVLDRIQRSTYVNRQGVVFKQPVPFSHDHHVAQIGISCQYCHTAVETAASAGMPPTATCMNCHKQIWSDSPMLEPVRASFRTNQPLVWARIHDLPDFVYFNHSIHVAKGIGCESCHGRVDKMPLMYQQASLQMDWCLECHRNPEKFIRPREEVYTMGYQPKQGDPTPAQLIAMYQVAPQVTCSTCHR
jgi:hypothetical protein